MENEKIYKEIIDVVPPHSKTLAKELIEEMLFMKGTLLELKELVTEEGAIVEFKQGKQELVRENPALKSYTSISGRYNQYLGRLKSLIPETENIDADLQELQDFLVNE